MRFYHALVLISAAATRSGNSGLILSASCRLESGQKNPPDLDSSPISIVPTTSKANPIETTVCDTILSCEPYHSPRNEVSGSQIHSLEQDQETELHDTPFWPSDRMRLRLASSNVFLFIPHYDKGVLINIYIQAAQVTSMAPKVLKSGYDYLFSHSSGFSNNGFKGGNLHTVAKKEPISAPFTFFGFLTGIFNCGSKVYYLLSIDYDSPKYKKYAACFLHHFHCSY